MKLNPYINFNGNCAEALKFYEKALSAKVLMTFSYGESPMAKDVAPELRDKILHARFTVGEYTIMAADEVCKYEKPAGFHITINMEEPAEAEKIFKLLSEKGSITMPIEETFWAHRFGMLVDQFGIPWMINCEKKQ